MKRERFLSWLLICAVFLSVPVPSALGVKAVTATAAGSKLIVDGAEVSCGAYEIAADNGYSNNYFKLRDVAALLNGTSAQFSVGWDGVSGTVSLTAGKPYTPVGGELAPLTGTAPAVAAQGAVYVNGRRADLTAYVIGQNNYFKLRDLGEALGFGVEWNSAAGAVCIESDPFEMTLWIASEPQTIDPTLNSAVDGTILIGHLFEGLMRWGDSGLAVEGADNCNQAQLVPGQAQSYEKRVNQDGTVTYTFHLKDGIKWSDGQPVTAGDFVYSWQRLADPYTSADYCYIIDMVKGWESVCYGEADPSALGVSAPDDKTFVVELSYDCPYFLEVCAFHSTVPLRQDMIEMGNLRYKEYLHSLGYEDLDWSVGWSFYADTYVSNGPYHLTEWIHNSHIHMEASETYYGAGQVGPSALNFLLSDYYMTEDFDRGEVDFIEDVPVGELMERVEKGEMHIVPYIGTYYICYNTEMAPFDDWRVRKAFTLAINSQEIVDTVTRTGQLPATGFVPSGTADKELGSDFRTVGGDYWDAPTTEEQYRENVAEARELLAQAGYPDGEGFPVVTYLYNISDRHRMIGEALQKQWREALHVDVKLESQYWGEFLETRRSGDYQLARNGWIADYNDPITFLDMWITGGGNNDAQYTNPDYDAAIWRAKTTSDPAERMAAMHEAENILIGQDWALGPIYFYTQKYMLNDRITGLYYTPLGYFYFDRCQRK